MKKGKPDKKYTEEEQLKRRKEDHAVITKGTNKSIYQSQRKDRKMSKTGTERFNEAKKEKHSKKKSKVVLITKKHLVANVETYSCPRCEEDGINLWMFFCPTCGVKIRWSKECKGKG